MIWAEAVKEHISALKPVTSNAALLGKMLGLIDLTSLNEDDTPEKLAALLEKANTPMGNVAAVCVYPQFLGLAKMQFAGTAIKTATVANFPHGNASLESVLIEINDALTQGAQEIDLVFPYHRYLAGEQQYAQTFVSTCKAACGPEVKLKVILETGALLDNAIIADASWSAIAGGADFLKTSTGKISQGATLEAAATMLLVIHHAMVQTKKEVGIKISGGVKTVEQASQYMELASNIMGRDWVNPSHLRLGASQLLYAILTQAL